MIGMRSGKTESFLHYINHLWRLANISRKGLDTPFILSVSCYFIMDSVVRGTTIIFEKKRTQVTNKEKIKVWEGGGNVSAGKYNMQLGSVSDMFCFSEHWGSVRNAHTAPSHSQKNFKHLLKPYQKI